MRVYIDKNNLVSLISSARHPMFPDCNRMLKNKFDIYFNFKKEEIKDNAEIKLWITSFVDGFKGVIKYSETSFPERPLKSNMHISFDRHQLSSVYMIEDDKVNALKDKGCFLICDVGEEIETLSHLIIKHSDYEFDKKIEIRRDLKCWEDFEDHLSPCSDIILIDQFILCDDSLYKYNIDHLLTVLCKNANNSKLNIVIITLKDNYDNINKITFTPDWVKIKRTIKQNIKKTVGIEPNVTFVLSSKNNFKEHDRTVFTNYRRIYSGDTLNYFGHDGNIITKGREVHLCSLANKETLRLAFSLINDIQTLIDEINTKNSDLIKGDKKSNYLNF